MSHERVTGSSTATQFAIHPQASRLLALPVEIQLQIYRHAWTFALQGENDKRATSGSGPHSRQLRKQLSAIRAMGAVSREMRSHVYAEFFSRTQAYITTDRMSLHFAKAREVVVSRAIMTRSSLLWEQLQHVCVVLCEGSGEKEGYALSRGTKALRWLESLKRLKTLEVVFDLGNLPRLGPMIGEDGTMIGTRTFQPACRWFDVQGFRRLTLPRLDKVVARWYARGVGERTFSWEETPPLKELKEEFEKLAPASEDTEQRCYKFHQHIGVNDGHDWPPYSHQI